MRSPDFTKKKRARTRGPHSKSGCTTCKTRRRKCDETRPTCRNCSNSGWRCDYLSPMKESPKPPVKHKILTPWLPRKVTSPVGLAPQQRRFDNDAEHLYFTTFCDKIAVELGGYFDSDIWSYIVLQACENEPSIKQAVIAIGALPPHGSRESAIKAYQKSISMLQTTLRTRKIPIRNQLLTCLLYLHFELLAGFPSSAVSLTYNGINMIEDFLVQTDHRTSISSPAPLQVEDEIIQIFGRLELHAMGYVDTRSKETHQEHRRCGEISISGMPTHFSTLKEARVWLELIMRRACHWMATLDPNNASARRTSSLTSPEHKRTHHEQCQVFNEFNLWRIAVGPLWTSACQPANTSTLLIASSLRLKFLSAYLTLLTATGDRSIYYGGTDSELTEICNLARSILSHPKTTSASPLSWDVRVITPLACVARVFRNRVLRREAVGLLMGSRRTEGVWDSQILGRALQWLSSLEEKGLPAEEVEAYIPEHRVAKNVKISSDAQRRETRVTCEVPMRWSFDTSNGGQGGERVNRKFVVKWDEVDGGVREVDMVVRNVESAPEGEGCARSRNWYGNTVIHEPSSFPDNRMAVTYCRPG